MEAVIHFEQREAEAEPLNARMSRVTSSKVLNFIRQILPNVFSLLDDVAVFPLMHGPHSSSTKFNFNGQETSFSLFHCVSWE